MEEEHKVNTLIRDYKLFGEIRIEDKPEYEQLLHHRYSCDINIYTHKDYDDFFAISPEGREDILNLDIIKPLSKMIQDKGLDYDLSRIHELKLLPIETIKPASELLDLPLNKNLIKSSDYKQSQSVIPLPTPWLNGGNIKQIFGDYQILGATQPEDLPEMALPVLEFMEDVQPHIVIGCDRGGRLFGLAMHAAWQHTRGGQPFPTLDGKLHFARVSKSEDPGVLQQKIDEIVEASVLFGKQRGNVLADDEQLRVLFVDDWVIGGGTKRLAKRLMNKYNAQTYFAVMCGRGADATGKQELQTHVGWHDRPEEIGVNYLSTLEANPDGTFTQKQEVIAVRSVEAIRNRQRIQEAARQLAIVRVLAEVA